MQQVKLTRYPAPLLEEFRVIVLEKIEDTKKVLNCLAEAIGIPTAEVYGAIKMYEDGSETNEQENICSLAHRQIVLLKKLEQALERINNGTYGICLKTGQLIEEDRLRLVPHTEYCLAAKVSAPLFPHSRKVK